MTVRKTLFFFLALLLSSCASIEPRTFSQDPAGNTPTSPPLLAEPAHEAEAVTAPVEISPTLLPTLAPTLPPPPTLTPTELPAPTSPPPPIGPPGIILFIGDGMGSHHRQAATWLASGTGGLLVMDNMPIHGFAQTAAFNEAVTDSGAAATAISTGVQTNYKAIGVNPQDDPVATILEQAQAIGWAVGLISTVSLTDATPAAFAAHVTTRTDTLEIARQMSAHQIDVLLGGGEDDFLPTGEKGCYPNSGHQGNMVNLVKDALTVGYTYICTGDELANLDYASTDHLIGLFEDEEMVAPYSPNLVEMTQAAIEILSQDPDGFFLMVEAGQIDWAAHENDAWADMQFTLELDASVAMAKIYAVGNPNTLIIVTADHETGGMRVNTDGEGSYRQDGPFNMPDGTPFWVDWSSGSHTAEDIPVTAQGPFSEMLSGTYHLTQIYQTMYLMLYTSGQ